MASFTESIAEMKRINDNQELLIIALVKMLGGSVTVSVDEMEMAINFRLDASVQQDPKMFILKIEEDV